MKRIRQAFATHSLHFGTFVRHFQEFGSVDGNQSQHSQDICKDPQAFLTLSQRHRFVQAPPRPFASYSVISA